MHITTYIDVQYIWTPDTTIFWSRCSRPWCQLCRCSSSLQAGQRGDGTWRNIMTLIFPKPKVSSCRFCVTPFCYCHQKTVILEVRSTSYHRCECWPTGIAISGGKAPVNRVAAGVLCARLAYVSHGWIGWFSLLWLHAAVLSLLKWQVFSQGKMKQLVATNSTSVFWTYSFNNVTWCDLDLDIQLRNRMLTHWFAKNWVWDDVNCCS